MNSAGDSFAWPFADQGWFGKMILQGLIALIPIIGHIALFGWMFVTLDNYRAGRRELAPAGFHLERGIALYLVVLVYVIVLFIPGGIVNAIGTSGNSNGLAALGGLLYLAAALLIVFLSPAIFLNTYRGGFSGGFDVAGTWQLATGNLNPTFLAAVLMFVADVISGLGVILCFVGVLFTVPYAASIMAGVVAWYEKELAGPAPVAARPPASTN